MRASSADLLEFDALKSLLARYVASPLGAAELEKLSPCADRAIIEDWLDDAREAIEYVRSASKPEPGNRGTPVCPRFAGFPDTAQALARMHIEGVCLEPKEIRDLVELLARAGEIRSLLLAVEAQFPRLAGRAAQVAELSAVVRDLSGKILPDGTVADHASTTLARLRRDVEKQRKLIQESLERFLRAHREDDLLQEEFVTIRNERFVVPVIAGRQRKIDGVIHGASASGHTLFVEPFETIELNNQLVRLAEEELQEVHRILREMTDRLRAHEVIIRNTVKALGELELLFAKANFAADFTCVVPRFSPDSAPRLILREARHPLLEAVLQRQKKPVVPVSVSLESGCRTLLISGPNTGGKTVVLKTIGLLALMAQAGLPVPCTEAELPLFDQVLADFGDNQSIQESLSTFSAHIGRLGEMLNRVGPRSLVVLDELGRATDPEEAGALGVAVLERFRAQGAFTIASTHLLALKMYGAATPGVINGAMGFDEETLVPTYVLTLGAPGKSAGLEIAARLGMPSEVIEQARSRMRNHEQEVNRFLSELGRHVRQVALLEQELRERKAELDASQQALAAEWQRRESAKLKELEKRHELVLQKFEAQAKETLERLAADAERSKKLGAAARRIAALKRELLQEIEITIAPTVDKTQPTDVAGIREKLREGARVRIKGVKEPARLRRMLGEDQMEVETGALKLQISVDDVLQVLEEAGTSARPVTPTFSRPLGTGDAHSLEINIIGKRAEEARQEVEKFLDNAILTEAMRLRIIHGHGMGILKRTVAEVLAKNPNVEKFYPAEPHEGGAGATIVELKA